MRPVYSKEYWIITHMSFDHDLADVHYTYFMAGQVLPKDADHRMLEYYLNGGV